MQQTSQQAFSIATSCYFLHSYNDVNNDDKDSDDDTGNNNNNNTNNTNNNSDDDYTGTHIIMAIVTYC